MAPTLTSTLIDVTVEGSCSRPTCHFDSLCQFYVDPQSTILVSKYRSSKTGLTVVHVDLDSTLASAFLTVATEAFDDGGLAHCLEHLVFLGSERYPYKGVLDSFATRAFARGTNAWTDIDHTCYNIMTAGSEGLLRFLPVYVDHILYPTLTESGFYTEIHHVNEFGEDAGVVYCEVQGRQNTMFDRMQSRMRQLLFPNESCPYRNEPGGKMESIRQLNVRQVRSYHQIYYRPDNLCIVIAGRLDRSQLFGTLNTIDRNILQYGCPPLQSNRPWSDCLANICDLQQSITEAVLFPDTDESIGAISISWLGPLGDQFPEMMAIQILNTYLTDSSLSPLQKLLVEVDNPLCTHIECSQTEHARTSITINIENVPVAHADQVVPTVIECLKQILTEENIEMDRMISLIDRERLKVLEGFETRALFCVSFSIINDFIYGHPDGKELEASLQRIKPLEQLYKYSKKDWLDLLEKYYINGCYVALIGKPSSDLAQQLQQAETKRIQLQRVAYGPDRLKALAKELETANQLNEIQIPSTLLDSFPIPKASDIASIDIITARHPSPPSHLTKFRNELQSYIEADETDTPYFIQFNQIQSAFTTVSVYLNTGNVPSSLRPYAKLYMESLFSLPLGEQTHNKQATSSDDLIRQLNKDTIDYRITQGRGPSFKEHLVLLLKVETSKYEQAVQWLNHLLWHTEFRVEKLKIAVSKILNDIPQAKRNGRKLAEWVMHAYQYDIENSTDAACGYLYQSKFLPGVLEKLNTNSSSNQVLQDMNSYRSIICSKENIHVHVMGNIYETSKPRSAFDSWKKQAPISTKISDNEIAPVTRAKDVLGNHGSKMGHISVIVIQPSMESTCSVHSAPGPSDFGSPDIPALMVLIEMLHAVEGVFWRLVRGKGLAYRCWIMENIEAGSLSLWILQSPDAYKAYEQIKSVMTLYANGDMLFDVHSLEGAKSSIIFDFAQSEATKSIAAVHSFINQVLRQNQPDKKEYLKAIQAVTLKDVELMLHKYLMSLFREDCSNNVIVSSPAKAQDIMTSFRSIGFRMTLISPDDIYSS